MNGHYIEQCRDCNAVISQCRCPDLNKIVRFGICSQCAGIRDIQLRCTLDRVRPFVSTARRLQAEGTPVAISSDRQVVITSFGDICLMLDEIDRREEERNRT